MKHAGWHELKTVRNGSPEKYPDDFKTPARSSRYLSRMPREVDLHGRQHPRSSLMSATIATTSPVVENLLERFITPLFAGDRSGSRAIVAEAFEEGLSAEEI